MSEESFITEQDIENLKARDERFRLVDIALKVDAELNNSVALNLILESAARNLQLAKERLVDVDPTDTASIMTLQIKAQSARLISNVLTNIRISGLNAQASIMDEETIELNREDSHG